MYDFYSKNGKSVRTPKNTIITNKSMVADAMVSLGMNKMGIDDINLGIYTMLVVNEEATMEMIPIRYHDSINKIRTFIREKYKTVEVGVAPVEVHVEEDSPMKNVIFQQNTIMLMSVPKMAFTSFEKVISNFELTEEDECNSKIALDRHLIPYFIRFPYIVEGSRIDNVYDFYIRKFGPGYYNFHNIAIENFSFNDLRRVMRVSKDFLKAVMFELSRRREKLIFNQAMELIIDKGDDSEDEDYNGAVDMFQLTCKSLFLKTKSLEYTCHEHTNLNLCIAHNRICCSKCDEKVGVTGLNIFQRVREPVIQNFIMMVWRFLTQNEQLLMGKYLSIKGFMWIPYEVLFKVLEVGLIQIISARRKSYGSAACTGDLCRAYNACRRMSQHWWYHYVTGLNVENYRRYGSDWPVMRDIRSGVYNFQSAIKGKMIVIPIYRRHYKLDSDWNREDSGVYNTRVKCYDYDGFERFWNILCEFRGDVRAYKDKLEACDNIMLELIKRYVNLCDNARVSVVMMRQSGDGKSLKELVDLVVSTSKEILLMRDNMIRMMKSSGSQLTAIFPSTQSATFSEPKPGFINDPNLFLPVIEANSPVHENSKGIFITIRNGQEVRTINQWYMADKLSDHAVQAYRGLMQALGAQDRALVRQQTVALHADGNPYDPMEEEDDDEEEEDPEESDHDDSEFTKID